MICATRAEKMRASANQGLFFPERSNLTCLPRRKVMSDAVFFLSFFFFCLFLFSLFSFFFFFFLRYMSCPQQQATGEQIFLIFVFLCIYVVFDIAGLAPRLLPHRIVMAYSI